MNVFLKKILKILKLKNLEPYIDSLISMGRKSEVTFPNELLPLNLEILAKGLLTSRVFEINSNWVYPFWIEEQLNPKSTSFVARGANIFAINTTHRNWTTLGFPESSEKGVIDEKGLISPRQNFPSLDIFIEKSGNFFFPSREKIKQKFDTETSLITTSGRSEKFEYNLQAFSSVRDFGIYIKFFIRSKESTNYKIYFLARPFNPESFIPIKKLEFKNEKLYVNDKIFIIPITENYKKILFDEESDILDNKVLDKEKLNSKYGMITGGIYYELDIKENEEKELEIFLPQEDFYKVNNFYEALNFNKKFYEKEKENELKISTPDEKINEIFNANKIFLKTLISDSIITPGPLTYKRFWFRDSAYMISALSKIGDFERSKKILKEFPKKQKRNGYFLSQNGEWDSNGQAIFTLVEYYRLSKDKEFLKEIYNSIYKGAVWIEKKRKSYKESIGLLPPGFSAEHFGPNDFYYYDDYFGLRGIFDASYASKEVNLKENEELFLSFYNDFKKSVRDAIDDDQKRLNKKIVLGAYGRNIDASMIGTFTSIFPLRLDLLTKEEILNTYEILKQRFFERGCFYQNITHSGINLYLTLEIANSLLFLDEYDEAKELFKSVIKLLKPTFTGPEAINPKTLGGCEGDGHHGWLVAEILHFIRNSLVYEKGNDLIIFSGAFSDWFEDGNYISFIDGPTHFGKLSFNAKIKEKIIELDILTNLSNELENLIIILPFEVERVIEGDFKRKDKNKLIFSPLTKKIIIERR
ncbi:MAG: hypothetical protein N3D74_06000 [Caldisericia bacterium]|nr:hypothetical protein [Caldisericia bacterium]